MGKNCIRVSVIVLNILFLVIGSALLGLSIWVYLDKQFDGYKGLNKDEFNIILFMVMGIGAFTAFIALCGCCGAIYMSPCLLGVFFALLLIIFLIELSIALLGFLMQDRFQKVINESSKKLVESAKINEKVWQTMEATQVMLKCCGDERGPKAFDGPKFPNSCCKSMGDSKIAVFTKNAVCNRSIGIYYDTCPNKTMQYVQKHGKILLAVLITVVATELFGMIFAIILCCNVRRYEDEGYVGVNI